MKISISLTVSNNAATDIGGFLTNLGMQPLDSHSYGLRQIDLKSALKVLKKLRKRSAEFTDIIASTEECFLYGDMLSRLQADSCIIKTLSKGKY